MAIRSNIKAVIESLGDAFNDHDVRSARMARIAALEIERQLILLSPVDKGYYRAAHDLTINAPSGYLPPNNSAVFNAQTRGSGEETKQLEKAQARLNTINRETIRKGVTIFFTNNAPYATVLERGSSLQAAQGIYTVVSKRFPKIIAAARRAAFS